MPTWQPNWQNVRFGFSQIEEAADACERLAQLLDETQSDRRHRGERALAEWRGGHADEFRSYLQRTNGDAANLVSELRGLAVQLRNGADRARSEQRSRDTQRLAWRREKLMEDLADLLE